MITACGFVTAERKKFVNDILVATVITACGFVTFNSSTYLLYASIVATVITACGFVTHAEISAKRER